MRRLLLAIALFVAAPAARAQDATTVDPGMSRDEVVARLGRPLSERAAGSFVYLFYANGCERQCGFNDVVILENGIVVDAVFRGGRRQYSGTSSSPAGVEPQRTRADGTPAPRRAPRQARSQRRAPGGAAAGQRERGDEVRLPSGAPSGSGIVVGSPAPSQASQPAAADAAAGATTPANAAGAAQRVPPPAEPVQARPAASGPTSTPANSTSGQTPVTGPGGAPRPAAAAPAATPSGGASLTPRVTQPAIPPAARPDSTSIPPLPSVPDQRTGVAPGQRATALDSARLDRLERQRQQQRDSTPRTP